MKKILAMLSLGVLIAGGSVYAQTAPEKDGRFQDQQRGERAARVQKERQSPEQFASDRTARLDEKLKLNKSQEKKVYALFLQQAQEHEQAMANGRIGERRDGQRKESKKNRSAKYNAELKKILSKKQYAKYEADRQLQRNIMETRDQKRGRDFKRGENRLRLEKQDS